MKKTCLIVGGGISGLSAAQELQRGGAEVIVLDKGYRPGGRMATRRLGRGLADYGAQVFTAHTSAFQRQIDTWRNAGPFVVCRRCFWPQPDRRCSSFGNGRGSAAFGPFF